MSAVWLWTRADLRTRWRSWVVLGLLAGATFGLAAAGVAGARRTANEVPNLLAATQAPVAGVLANDPGFDAQQRAAVASLPNVRATYPFMVPIALEVVRPKGLDANLLPTDPSSVKPMVGVLVDGRMPDPAHPDEVVVDQNTSRRFGLGIGDTFVVGQSAGPDDLAGIPPGMAPPGATLADVNFRATLRVVGISKSLDNSTDWTPSSGFYTAHESGLVGFVNLFVALRGGQTHFSEFRDGVQEITGKPTNVENFYATLAKTNRIMDIEQDGLLLFALAVLVGGGVLVGQALVRAVNAGGAELPTLRAIGADRRLVVRALVLPAALTAAVAAVTTVVVAVGLSSRFPIGLARSYDLDLGTHADWTVLGLAALAVVGAVLAAAWVSAFWRVTRGEHGAPSPSTAGGWAARAGLPAAFVIGARLAVEPGRGRRAVPVRSAMVGAIVGVLGVVACFTFRAGVDDAIASPQRSGIVWDYQVVNGEGTLSHHDLATITRDPAAAAVLDAVWQRAVRVNHVPTPTFGITRVKGAMSPVVLRGHAPHGRGEIAFAPSTMRSLRVHIGDRVEIEGTSTRTVKVVGEALLPATSHTDYDESGWMTAAGLRASLPPAAQIGPDDTQDFVLVRWAPGTDAAAAAHRLTAAVGHSGAYYTAGVVLPSAVADLGRMRELPLWLGVFFGLLACATVAHALVTTVRRRRFDLAVLRSFGFTRRQSRTAIAWQATLLAIVGLVVGVPLGVVTGRLIWRWLADNFPVVYVPPLALVAVLVVVPAALLIANALAAGPARAASRIHPAEVLRAE
jgi:hypothetical protein